ncbi:hypothetical protein VYU27_007949, partial [Nannochloropsis oceanica]
MDVEDEAHRVVQQKIVFTRMAYSRQVFEASMRGASLRATTAAMSAFEAWVEEGHAKGKPPSLADVWKEVKEAEEEQMEKGSRRWLGRPPHADHAAPPSAFPPPLPPPTPPETPTTLRAMGPIWIVEKYDQISTRIAKRWRQVLGKHGARFHPHFVPGKTRVVILPSRLSRATVNKLLPCDCRDVRLLTQEWAVEAIKRAIALGEAKTKEGGGEGGKEGRKEGGGLRPPPYAQYLFVDPADLTAHGAAAEEEQEQARGGGREGKDKGRKRLRGAVGRWGCMEASSDGIVNLNKHLTPLFEELAAIYEMLGNEAAQGPFRKRQYGRLVSLLKSLPFKVDEGNVKQLQKIKGVGKSIAKDIQEILTRGRLSRLEALKMTQGVGARLGFQKIWGVGPVTARALYEHDGIGSIAELRARVVTHPGILNENQRIGLKYYEELQQRIPRAEASEIERR